MPQHPGAQGHRHSPGKAVWGQRTEQAVRPAVTTGLTQSVGAEPLAGISIRMSRVADCL